MFNEIQMHIVELFLKILYIYIIKYDLDGKNNEVQKNIKSLKPFSKTTRFKYI